MTATLAPVPVFRALDANGAPLAGGKLYTYAAGTTTPLATYTDSTGGTPNTNPVILDANGQAAVWLGSSSYKMELRNSADVVQPGWPVDGISSTDALIAASFANLANTSDVAKGDALVGVKRTATGSVATTLHNYIEAQVMNVKSDFGAVGDGTADDTSAIAAAQTWAASQATPTKVIFPAGTYKYTASPNWAIAGLTLQAEGRVILKYTGSSVAWQFDSPVSNLYGIRMLGDFNISGAGTATDGLWTRGCHHSVFEASVWNVSAAGVRVNFGIENTYRVRVTSAGFPMTLVQTPANGIVMDKRNAGERCGSLWERPIVEYVTGVGCVMTSVDGAVINHGTFENCGGKGLTIAADCYYPTFVGLWMEGNTTADMDTVATSPTFLNLHCGSVVTPNININSGAQGTAFFGGTIRSAVVNTGSLGTVFNGVGTSDNGALGISGAGPYKTLGCYRYNGSGVITTTSDDLVGTSGTFTPTIIGSTTPGVQTYTAQAGFYTIVGKMLYWNAFVTISAKDGAMAGNAQIGGFPRTFKNSANCYAAIQFSQYDGVTMSAGHTQLGGYGNPGGSTMLLIQNGSAIASATVTVANIAATTALVMSGSYLID